MKGGIKINIVKGDITLIKADAIVNAANSSLMGGGGVDGAIHKAGGPAILKECKEIRLKQGPCNPGTAVITTGGILPCSFVIHTVGPVWTGGNQNEKSVLAECYKNSLTIATKHQCNTVAFPGISTGIYRFPKEEASKIALRSVIDFLKTSPENCVKEVIFVCYEDDYFNFLKNELYNSALN